MAHVSPGAVQDRWPGLLDDPLLLAQLAAEPVTNLRAEFALTQARRQLCLHPPAQPTALTTALASQGALTEYVWSISDEEAQAIDSSPSWVRAMYRYEGADPGLGERSRGIRTLTAVSSGTSTTVQAMYEQNPYPRWRTVPTSPSRELCEKLQDLSDGAFEPPTFLREPRLLAAGCGTGREMLSAALATRTASVTGVDLSRTSLAYALLMAESLGVDVELYQADLVELAGWDRQFDVIICTGVLHHLDDPAAGLRTLVRLLRPGGVMLLGLYSKVARAGIAVAQADVRDGGWPPTPDGIRAARTHIIDLPVDHPGRDCARLGDFYYLSGCRDMLFHVREHTFTLPAIAALLDDIGLDFIACDGPEPIRTLYRTLFGAGQSLTCWHTLERLYPRSFLGMYQFWCHRPDTRTHPTRTTITHTRGTET